MSLLDATVWVAKVRRRSEIANDHVCGVFPATFASILRVVFNDYSLVMANEITLHYGVPVLTEGLCENSVPY